MTEINPQNFTYLNNKSDKAANISDSCLRGFMLIYLIFPKYLFPSFTMPCTFWCPDTCKRWKSSTSRITLKTNIQVPEFPINGYCFYQRVQMMFSQIKYFVTMRNINSRQFSLKTIIKALVLKQMGKLKHSIMKKPTFTVAKMKMSISTSLKGQGKSTCIYYFKWFCFSLSFGNCQAL